MTLKKNISPLVLHPLGNGYIAIGHKPGGKISYDLLKQNGITTVITLLHQHEGALIVQNKLSKLGIEWIWFPFSASNPPQGDELKKVTHLYVRLKEKLENSGVIYIHCSAGIHRTGMITYGLLRFLGNDVVTSHQILLKLRQVASEQAGEERLKWGDLFYNH